MNDPVQVAADPFSVLGQVEIFFDEIEFVNERGALKQRLSMETDTDFVVIHRFHKQDQEAARTVFARAKKFGFAKFLIAVVAAAREKAVPFKRTEEFHPKGHQWAGRVQKISFVFDQPQARFWSVMLMLSESLQ